MRGIFAAGSLPFMRQARYSTVLLLMITAVLQGCSTLAYYSQAIGGHLQVMQQARPVDTYLADSQTPERLRAKLSLALQIREFASRELGLPDNGSYRRYADLGRPYVLWNVFAAPAFSVKPVESCFPIAGCVDYRGWYSEAAAQRAAQALQAQGFDTFIGGVPAYSTLGWFDDPLLNTFISFPDYELARLIFHELAHQLVYVRNDSTFNESFAVVIEEEGLRRWFARLGAGAAAGAGELSRYESARARRREFIALMLECRARLAQLYAQNIGEEEKRIGKGRLLQALEADYQRLKSSWDGFAGYDRFFAQGVNNAMLASIATYNEKVPAFRFLLTRENGDLPAFLRVVREYAQMPRAARDTVLQEISASVVTSPSSLVNAN